ncbi:hypothetical protein [Nonomuraea sp. SYSU D8015]|uniref:hypothetical protein n=1 Tax=Nonomuraea sp. SYSU D8015 TaxID=2593644 RepID=UPI001660BC6E|nr:hypothetical protein [Nonomuraea sp. SYSU D8015]
MDLNEVFTSSGSPFTETLTAYRVTPRMNTHITNVSTFYGLAKSEVVRYCLAYALENVDWAQVVREKLEGLQ